MYRVPFSIHTWPNECICTFLQVNTNRITEEILVKCSDYCASQANPRYTINTRDNGARAVHVSPWTRVENGVTVRGYTPTDVFQPPQRPPPLINRNARIFLPLRHKIDPMLINAVRDRAQNHGGGFGWPSPDLAREIINAPDRQYQIGNGRNEIPQNVVFAAFPDIFQNPNPAAAHPDDLARVAPGTLITLEQHATIPPIGGQREIDDANTRRPRNPSLNTRSTISHITLNLVI